MTLKKHKNDAYVAVLISGTYREIEFLLQLFPYMAGKIKYDIFLIIRHVRTDESSHFGVKELDFKISQLKPFMGNSLFLCELPYIDPATISSKYLVPVGPTNEERECAMLSMFHGVFTGISMLQAALRPYTHVMKTRTDYLPWTESWISGMLELYKKSGKRMIVDGSLTVPQRYPDRTDIFWQGSISDLFCFASVEQFLTLWGIEEILPKVWTGIAETTLFRAAMFRFLNDEVQSHRRNTSFLNKYFIWQKNDTKQSLNMLRSGVLTEEIKICILDLLKNKQVSTNLINKLIRITYDFLIGAILNRDTLHNDIKGKLNGRAYPDEYELERIAEECLLNEESKLSYINMCKAAILKACPI